MPVVLQAEIRFTMMSATFRDVVNAEFRRLKQGPFGTMTIGHGPLQLLPVTTDYVQDDENLAMLARWRQENLVGFPRHETVTLEGTRGWSKAQLIEREDRILFLITEASSALVGHIGLSSFDFAAASCEFDNVIRGNKQARKGIMADACRLLIDWTYDRLAVKRLWVRTFLDNQPAITLYYRVGFRARSIAPLIREERPGLVQFLPAPSVERIDRFDIVLEHEH